MALMDSDTGDDTGRGRDRESTTATPRWVKVFGIIAFGVGLLFVILMFTRGPGGHTPSRHFGAQAPPSGVIENGGRGQTPREGHR